MMDPLSISGGHDDDDDVVFVSSTPIRNISSENNYGSSASTMSLQRIQCCLNEISAEAEKQNSNIHALEGMLHGKVALEMELTNCKQRCHILETELNEMKSRLASAEDVAARLHDESLQTTHLKVKNIMRKFLNVFDCCICSELLLQPGVTNCNHIFCSQCIGTWRAANEDCPVCRTTITSIHMVREIDEFITSVVQSTSDAEYAERLQRIEERNHVKPRQIKKRRNR